MCDILYDMMERSEIFDCALHSIASNCIVLYWKCFLSILQNNKNISIDSQKTIESVKISETYSIEWEIQIWNRNLVE